ncbi:c-type cytochrome [Mesorhizobium neociceri]|uniref:C-type cytochrome n=1 Tax=Mesorhizobium neociceri TaxID=1307853 RepID=A0A838BGY7_9HYPH|nr:c-type cytochrome [Mesorhizobium neociceri]MBA1144754.1 c-type cytochrome [Mesorhizobium neociceri]
MANRLASAPGRVALTMVLVVGASAAFVTASVVRDKHTKAATARMMTGGDPDRAPAIFRRYGCSGCHTISGIPGADGQAGAPLTELSKRVYIAGVLENRPDNLVAWIVSPRSFSPQTAMPQSGISEQEARDLAAYLYAQ